jgi:hypothetical protein
MKKVRSKIIILNLIVFLLFFLTSTVQAENVNSKSPFDKGSISVGGSFSFESKGGDFYLTAGGSRRTTFLLTPSARYFIMRNLGVGIDFTYLRTTAGEANTSQFGIGPAATYYFRVLGDKFYPYVNLGALYSTCKLKTNWPSAASGFGFRFGGGVAYMLGKKLAVIAELNYNLHFLKREDMDSKTGNIFAITIGLATFFY